jgi:hypothetical protein
MKLTLAIVVYVLIGWILGWGILEAVSGRYWIMIASVAFYLLAFARLGCSAH